ncbi:MAG: D-aminoacylase [Woeseia sp.]
MRRFTERLSIGVLVACMTCVIVACSGRDDSADRYDLIIRGGTIYDGLGGQPYTGDVAFNAERIAAIGDLADARADDEIDAAGLAVAPGFINMLSWATRSLIEDGRAMSDLKQGVTLEVMGEGISMGPLNDSMRAEMIERQREIRFAVEWTTLNEYLEFLEDRGVSPNIASYIGATSVRIHEIGYDDRRASDQELQRMQDLVRNAMRDGALGVGSSLIYAPASFADTEELIALVNAAAEFGGAYISHIRSEGNRLEEGVQELIKIASLTGAPTEIYHLKASGRPNWYKLQGVFGMIEAAREAGLSITADMYPYPASATGLSAAMPLWVQEGGHDAWIARLRDPQIRARVVAEMNEPDATWENRFVQAGAENILLLGFRNPDLRPLIGKTLAEVAELRGTEPAETAIDLVIEDDSRVDVSYFMMSEDNVRRKAAKPWISFGSDAAAPATEGVFLQSNPHPRAYGTFARVLGKFVREQRIMSLAEAISRMTAFPAANIGIRERGRLAEGYYADLVIFDPATIDDLATFENPHQYAVGVEHVFVNGMQVIRDGEHTGALPGRVVRGPGWHGWPENAGH